jgi:hypothetical protein
MAQIAYPRLEREGRRAMTAKKGNRLAADIGGTFTDVAAFDETTGRHQLCRR